MRLADFLQAEGQTDDEFAAKVGVNRTTVGRWRAGLVIPGRHALETIRSVTGGKVCANDFHSAPAAVSAPEGTHATGGEA